jgi:putative hydrolase of the HAD superfamily
VTAVRAVLFDYGHTLVSFLPAEENLLACYEHVTRMLEENAIRQVPSADEMVEAVARRVERLVRESYDRQELDEVDIVELFDGSLRALGVSLDRALVRQIAEMEHRALLSGLRVQPENLEVLRRLRERGVKIGLVSNAHFLPELMREDIARLGIASLVDDAVFSAEIGVRKPHPAIFDKVLGALGIRAGEAIFVGDRLHDDIGGAQKLGMRGVLTRQFRREEIDGQPVRPDHVIDALPELLPYVFSQLQADSHAAE